MSEVQNPRPQVSVVIPSKDRPVLVRRAVLTALAQRDVELEVVVIDDGSQPPVDLSIDDPRVRVIRHETARGVAAARNRGVRESRGRWVAFLDDDDLWSPDKLAIQVADLELSGRRWGCPGTVWLSGSLEVREFTMPPPPPVTLDVLRESNTVGSPSGVIAERDLVLEAGGFNSDFSIYADWDLWLRLASLAEGSSVRDLLLGYVTHDGSMHRQDLRELADELAALRRFHRGSSVGEIEAIGIWRWIAATQLDLGRRARAAAIYLLAGFRFRDRRALEYAVKNFGRGFVPRLEQPAAPPPPEWLAAQVAEIQAEVAAERADRPTGVVHVEAEDLAALADHPDALVVAHHADAIVGSWWGASRRADRHAAEAVWWARWRERRDQARTLLGAAPLLEDELARVAVVVTFTSADIALLGACLASVRAAVGPRVQVIVAGTTAATAGVRASCAAHDAVLIDTALATLAAARNDAWGRADADLIAFTDANCVVDERWLAGAAADFADRLTAAATGFIGPLDVRSEGAVLIEQHGAPAPRLADRRIFDPLHAPASDLAAEAGRSGNLIVRRRSLAEFGGFDAAASARTRSPAFDDVDLLWRLLHAGSRVRYSASRQVWTTWPSTQREARGLLADDARARSAWAKRAAVRDSTPLAATELGRRARHAVADALGRRDDTRRAPDIGLAARELRGLVLGIVLPTAGRALPALPRVEPHSVIKVETELPSLSVAVATFNRRDQLAAAMRAFREQSLPSDRFEMVVVVDGSTDGSADLARTIDVPFRVRVIEQENRGLALARNVGAAEASGDVVVFWDDDIHPGSDCLAAHARHHAAATSPTWLMGAFPPVVGDAWIDQWVRAHWLDHFRRKARPDHRWSFVDLVDGNSSIEARTFAASGGFDARFTGGRRQDWEMGLRLLRDGTRMAFSWEAFADHHTVVSYETMLRNASAEGRFDAILVDLHPEALPALPVARLDRGLAARRVRRAARALGDRRLASAASRLEQLGARDAWNALSGHARWAAYEAGYLEVAPIPRATEGPVVPCSASDPVPAGMALLGRTLRVARGDAAPVDVVAQLPGEQWDGDEAVNRVTQALMLADAQGSSPT